MEEAGKGGLGVGSEGRDQEDQSYQRQAELALLVQRPEDILQTAGRGRADVLWQGKFKGCSPAF